MKINKLTFHYILIFAIFILLLPLFWMFITSLKSQEQIFHSPLNLFPSPISLDNFYYVLNTVPLIKYIWNTFIISISVTFMKLFTSLLAAYAFSQLYFKGREIVFYMILLTIFIPFTITMIPNYLLMAKMGLLNTYSGVIIPQMADAMGIFLLRQSIKSIPVSLFEAAKLDGAGHFLTLRKIILPVIKPSITALGLLFFINTWNEYFWPLLMINDKEMYTLPLALQVFTNIEGGTNWGAMMSASVLTSLLPLIVYMIAQRQIISTFMQSGLKG